MLRFGLVLLACAGLAACQSTGDIAYAPTVPIVRGPPASIAGVTTRDLRDEKPNRLATVRGLYGNPSQVYDTTRPVADEVSEVFTAALQARGMLSPAAPLRMQITLRTFYGNTYFARRAVVDLDLSVVDPAGRIVYGDTYKNDTAGFEVFSGITDLVPFTQQLLNTAADTLLDKPQLRALLARPGPASRPPSS